MLLLFGIVSIIFLADTSNGMVNLEAKIGETITFTCNPDTNSSAQVLKWLKLEEETYHVLFTYQNSTGNVSYPNLHDVSSDEFGLWHNLTIKRVTTNDVGVYLCNQTQPDHFEAEVDLSVNGSIELRNMVVRYSTPLELTYITCLSVEDSVQWTYMNIDPSEIKTIHHVYYATSTGGGALPGRIGNFEPAGLGYGVLTYSSNQNTVGKYKYFVLDPPEVIQKEFWVIGTEGLRCHPENSIFEGKQHIINCSAVVCFGDVVPVFAWTKDNNTVQGSLLMDPLYTGYGKRWVYRHTFVAGINDANATFSCKISFRYDGDSSFDDTSDPEYTESCNIIYPYVDFSVRNTTITPDSDDGPFPIRVGQNLTCYADGYPEVEYEWFCEGYPVVRGQDYTITKFMVGPDIQRCSCVTENTLNDNTIHSQNSSVEFYATYASGIYRIPQDVVVQFGGSAILQCTAADFGNDTNAWRVQWAAQFDIDDTTSIIYYSGKASDGIINPWQNEFEEMGPKHNILMKYATASLAGTYLCMELNNFETDSWAAEVVVTTVVKCLGPKTKVKKGDSTTLSCQLEYAGHLRPMIQWFHGDVYLEDGKDFDVQKKDTVEINHNVQVSAEGFPHYRCQVSFWSKKKEIYKDECSINIDIGEV